MAEKKVGEVIRQARTEAGLTQEKLAAKVSGVSAADISRVERGEDDLTNEQLKRVAKALKVTQTSLLRAPKNGGEKAKKTKSTTSKKTTTTADKKATSTTAKKTTAASSSTLRLTAAEKALIKAYRAASDDTQKRALALLKGKAEEDAAPSLGEVLSGVLEGLIK